MGTELFFFLQPTRAPTAHAPNRSPRPDLRRSRVAAVRVLRQDYDHISALIEKEPRNDQGSVIVSGQHGTGCLCLRLAVSCKNFYSTAFVWHRWPNTTVSSTSFPSAFRLSTLSSQLSYMNFSDLHRLAISFWPRTNVLTLSSLTASAPIGFILTCHKHV